MKKKIYKYDRWEPIPIGAKKGDCDPRGGILDPRLAKKFTREVIKRMIIYHR